MVGFEILVNVPRDKRQEFLQTCELLGSVDQRNPACLSQTLFENVIVPNQFLWVEYWRDSHKMNSHLESSRFGVLMGAISVLGNDTNELKRLEMKVIDNVENPAE